MCEKNEENLENNSPEEDVFAGLSAPPPSVWTSKYLGIYGGYNWLNQDIPIHYFTTVISIFNTHEDISLMREIQGVEKWGFEALFQRNVDSDRIDEMVAFLNDETRFKFFPPVTIALLPCQNDLPQRDYDGEEFLFETKNGGERCTLQGLELFLSQAEPNSFPRHGSPASLKWDRQRFCAVAIDGQHRISALRAHTPRNSQQAPRRDVPATIILFDPETTVQRDLVQATREIFIDINRNAKPVDSSRLILLDDRNFYNVFSRSLIRQAYSESLELNELGFETTEDHSIELHPGIPQELVDTSANRDAVDATSLKPWQFISAFTLNKAIEHFVFQGKFGNIDDLCGTADFNDVNSDDKLHRAIAKRHANQDDGILSEKDSVTFDPEDSEALSERLHSRWRHLFLATFTGFSPYKGHIQRLISLCEDPNIDPEVMRSILLAEGSTPGSEVGWDSAPFLALGDNDQQHLAHSIKSKLSRPQSWKDSLVWYSVFQRGLLYQPLMIQRAMELAIGDDGFSSKEKFSAEFRKALDSLYNFEIYRKQFEVDERPIWAGICMKAGADGTLKMDGSDGAAIRFACLNRLMISALVGGYDGFQDVVGNNGIRGAITKVEAGYARHFRFQDAVAPDIEVKADDHYSAMAGDYLNLVLKAVSTL